LILKGIIEKVNAKIITLKEPLKMQLRNSLERIENIKVNIARYLLFFEKGEVPLQSVKEKVESLENELVDLTELNRL
jgi:site-specific DNA recombinase